MKTKYSNSRYVKDKMADAIKDIEQAENFGLSNPAMKE